LDFLFSIQFFNPTAVL